jgi:hypothetical protein
MLTLTAKEWTTIRKRLKEEYAWKPSVLMIRETMKRELGFTPRYHVTWSAQRGSEEVIYLDFYDDAKETWFRLKYL